MKNALAATLSIGFFFGLPLISIREAVAFPSQLEMEENAAEAGAANASPSASGDTQIFRRDENGVYRNESEETIEENIRRDPPPSSYR